MKRILVAAGICISSLGVFAQKPTTAAQLESYRKTVASHLPERNGRVNDMENIFSASEKHNLDSLLAAFEYGSAVDIAILTIDSSMVSKEQFDQLAQSFADKWKVGKLTEDRGILIALSRDHRKIRICNSEAVSALLTDDQTKRIIDEGFIPEFKYEDYYSGMLVGLNMLMSVFR